jgi:hypothetical protein
MFRKLVFLKGLKHHESSQVIEAKSVTSVYIGWRNTLQLTVDGGELNITLDESSIRSIANVLNNKIAELDEEKAEEARKLAAEPEEAESETV